MNPIDRRSLIGPTAVVIRKHVDAIMLRATRTPDYDRCGCRDGRSHRRRSRHHVAVRK